MVTGFQVEAIVPKKRGRGARSINKVLEREINRAYERFEGVLDNDMQRAVGTWKNKPKFQYKRQRKGTSETFTVQTDDKRWKWIDEGTKPHPIYPKRAKALRFQSGYSPATAPNRIIARPARSFGKVIYSQGVQHPGIKPRNLNERIRKRNQPKFVQFMNDALKAIT